MRALTIRQPWASAIAYGTKRVENRTWPAPTWITGQTIAIHAGKQIDHGAQPPVGQDWPNHLMHLGAVIAVATVAGCHGDRDCADHLAEPDRGELRLCSPWASEWSQHWVLSDVRALMLPVPCRGAQRLWRLPGDVEKAVREHLETGRQRCVYCGKKDYEPGWGCHTCGTATVEDVAGG